MPKCVLLEKGTTIQVDGSYSPCCQFEWQQDAPKDYNKFLQMRELKNQQMKTENWIPECRWCKDDHEFKGDSMRDHVNRVVEGSFWELWFNNTCNLACRMCNSALSSTWQQNIKSNPNLNWDSEFDASPSNEKIKFDETVFFNDLPNVKHLKLLGGEPFLIKEVKRVLEYVLENNLAQNINLHLTTNLTNHVNDWWKKVFQSFKSVTVIGSVDGIKKRYEYIRPGSNWDLILQTVDQLKKIMDTSKNFDFRISCTGQTLNAVQNDQIVEFWNSRDVVVDIEQMYYPDFMSYKSLSPTLRKKFNIKTTLDYDPLCWEKLLEQMEIQDTVHSTSFKTECSELFA